MSLCQRGTVASSIVGGAQNLQVSSLHRRGLAQGLAEGAAVPSDKWKRSQEAVGRGGVCVGGLLSTHSETTPLHLPLLD